MIRVGNSRQAEEVDDIVRKTIGWKTVIVNNVNDLPALDSRLFVTYRELLVQSLMKDYDKEVASGSFKGTFQQYIKEKGDDIRDFDEAYGAQLEKGAAAIQPATIDSLMKILSATSPKTIVIGTNLIATGIDPKPQSDVNELFAINLAFDENTFVSDQFKARVGRSGSFGIFVDILNMGGLSMLKI